MTTWYARQTANINAANVWNDVADGSGNWLTWPCAADDTLRANGFTLTINVNTTCAQVDTLTSGGGFTLNDGITLTADCLAGTTHCVTFSAADPAAAYIVGNCYGSTSNTARYGVNHSSTGTLTITGDCVGGTQTFAAGVLHGSTGHLVTIGDILGGTTAPGVSWGTGSGPTGEHTGTVRGGDGEIFRGSGILFSPLADTLHIVGDVFAGSEGNVHGINQTNPPVSTFPQLFIDGNLTSDPCGATAVMAANLGIIDGANHYTKHAAAEDDPALAYTGKVVTHYGEGLLPTPAEIADEVWTYDGPEGRKLT